MYNVDSQDRVIEMNEVPYPSVGAPLPCVVSDEYKLFLAYIAQNTPPDWDGTSVRVVTPTTSGETITLIEFERYCSYMFGMPNDEAFNGHPLASRGLHLYSAFQIEHSSWIRQLESMNSIHPYHSRERYNRLKHYIFAFHDSMFECTAENFALSTYEGSLRDVFLEIQKRLNW